MTKEPKLYVPFVDYSKRIAELEAENATLQAQWHELANEMENETGNMPADREPTAQEVIEQVRLLKDQLAATKEYYDEAQKQLREFRGEGEGG